MRTGLVSANMANNNNGDDLHHCVEAHKQTSKAPQKALDNIQHMLHQLLIDRNNEENSHYNELEEENKTLENKNAKESSSSSIDA